MHAITLALVLTLSHLVVSSPLGLGKGPQLNAIGDEQRAINYLTRFGYMEKNKAYNENQLKEALKKLQHFYKLPITGVVDEATLELIGKPRCGVPDIFTNKTRFVVGSEGFKKKRLTYMFGRYTPKLSRRVVDDSVRLAFEMWTKHAYLEFEEVGSNPDIMLDFVPTEHGDNYPFDGPGGLLAHAFYPTFPGREGDIHFEEVEDWNVVTPSKPNGYDFFSVVLHELGHALGLDHSTDKSAVMYGMYQYIDKKRGLSDDDKRGIYYIYVQGGKP